MKQTTLYPEHKALKAKLVDFNGWEMPIYYKGIIEEHHAVRESAGIFDVSHMGVIDISGPHALEFVQILTVNDASALKINQSQYTMIADTEGKIMDDMIVTRLADCFRFVVNCSNFEKIHSWMLINKKENDFKVTIEVKDELNIIALQGPKAKEIMTKLAKEELVMSSFYVTAGKLLDSQVLISHTGYTGEDGYEIFVNDKDVVKLWRGLLEAGAAPIGLGARDTLRIEAGLPLYGHEIITGISPYDLGYGWIVKLNKPKFIGKNVIENLPQKRRLYGLVLKEKTIPRQGVEVKGYGTVTSGTFSPTLNKSIALFITDKEVVKGDTVFVKIRDKEIEGEVTKLPFIKKGC